MWHSKHDPVAVERYRGFAQLHGLLMTGGSDFHGPHTGRTNPPGTPLVPISAWEGIQIRAARART